MRKPWLVQKSFILLAVILTVFVQFQAAFAENGNAGAPALLSESAVLIDQKSGDILFGKNPDQKMYPASTTKILTSLLALENGTVDEKVKVGEEVNYIEKDGSSAALLKGMEITLGDLVRGMMLPSGNDASYIVAVYIGRKVSGNKTESADEAVKEFVRRMNDRAKALGAVKSNFTNPDGYHDDNHYTTAYDIALIAREAMKNSFFKEVVKTYTYQFESEGEKRQAAVWQNKNELLNPKSKYYYSNCTGIKTGHTSMAGFCLVSSASKGELDLVGVVLNGKVEEDRWTDSKKILEYGLESFQVHQVAKEGDVAVKVNVKSGKSDTLDVLVQKSYSKIISKQDIQNIQRTILWDKGLVESEKESEIKVLAPVKKGQVVGKATYKLQDQVLFETDLVAAAEVEKSNHIYILYGVIGGAGLIGLLAVIFLVRMVRSRRNERVFY